MTSNSVDNSRNNRWTPLQCLVDNDEMESEVVIDPKKIKKERIPPIKVLQKPSDYIHNLMAKNNLTDYSIKRMSIGIKIQCESVESHKKTCIALKSAECQFFSHDLSAERSFKVVLFGLDTLPTSELKSELIRLGLKCRDIKLVTKQYEQYIETIYIVYLEQGSIRLCDLKKNIKSIYRTQVKWDYQRRRRGNITQCHNCQMFGHGEKNCHVKTFCANCSGPHKTSECSVNDKIQCANCKESHRSTDPNCVSRQHFLKIKENISHGKWQSSPIQNHVQQMHPTSSFVNSMENFPPLKQVPARAQQNKMRNSSIPTQSAAAPSYPPPPPPRSSQKWSNQSSGRATTSDETLFSMEEIQSLTVEMTTQLSHCSTKAEQFNVIAQLAIKYLYNKNDK